jgi:hypothetical protein
MFIRLKNYKYSFTFAIGTIFIKREHGIEAGFIYLLLGIFLLSLFVVSF